MTIVNNNSNKVITKKGDATELNRIKLSLDKGLKDYSDLLNILPVKPDISDDFNNIRTVLQTFVKVTTNLITDQLAYNRLMWENKK